MPWWLGVFFACGATLALIALVLPHPRYEHPTATAVLAASAYPVAGLLFIGGTRLSMRAIQLLTATGSLIVTLAILLGHHSQLAGISVLFYMWVPIFAFTFFSFRAALVQVAWIAVSFAVAAGIDRGTESLSEIAVVIGVLAITSAAVHSLVSEIRRLARTDPLTGLANRREFGDQLERELHRTRRSGTDLCVIIIDLDNFKQINDARGHQVGDRHLVHIACAWRTKLRADACLARYGGDEFAVLLPDTNPDAAAVVVQRLRDAVPTVQFSAGIAAVMPGDNPDDVIARADRNLYHAKHQRPTRETVPG